MAIDAVCGARCMLLEYFSSQKVLPLGTSRIGTGPCLWDHIDFFQMSVSWGQELYLLHHRLLDCTECLAHRKTAVGVCMTEWSHTCNSLSSALPAVIYRSVALALNLYSKGSSLLLCLPSWPCPPHVWLIFFFIALNKLLYLERKAVLLPGRMILMAMVLYLFGFCLYLQKDSTSVFFVNPH